MLPKLNTAEQFDEQHIDLVDQIKDNRQRLQKSMRAGQLNIVKSIKSLHVDINSFFDFQRDRAELQARQDKLDDRASTAAPANDDTIAPKIEDKTDQGFALFNLLSGSLIAFSAWAMDLDEVILAAKHGLTVVRDFALRPLHALASSKVVLAVGNLASNALKVFGNIRRTLVGVTESISIGSIVLKPLQSLFTMISSAGALLKNFAVLPALNAIKTIGSWLSSISGLSSIVRGAATAFSTAGRFLKYLGGPFTIAVIAALDATVGFIDGFKTGGWLGGIEGAFLGLVSGLITKPFDLIKDVIAWAAGKLGFDQWKQQIGSFSFTERFNMMWDKMKISISSMFNDLLWAWDNSAQAWTNIKTEISTTIEQKTSKIKDLLFNVVPSLIDQHVITPLTNFGSRVGSYLATEIFSSEQFQVGQAVSTIASNAWNSITSWLRSKLSIDRVRSKIEGITTPIDSVVSSVTTFVSGIFDLINNMIPSIQSIELGILKMIRSRIEKEGSFGDVLKYGLGIVTGDQFDLEKRIQALEGGNKLTSRLGAASSNVGPGQQTTVAIQGGPVNVDQRSPSTQVHNVYYYQYHTPSGHSHTSLPSRQ